MRVAHVLDMKSCTSCPELALKAGSKSESSSVRTVGLRSRVLAAKRLRLTPSRSLRLGPSMSGLLDHKYQASVV